MTPPSDALEALHAAIDAAAKAYQYPESPKIKCDDCDGAGITGKDSDGYNILCGGDCLGKGYFHWAQTVTPRREQFIAAINKRGFTIAPIARVTDERLREAVDWLRNNTGDYFREIENGMAMELAVGPDMDDQLMIIEAALIELQARRDADKKCDGEVK